MQLPRTILVATDFSEAAARALDYAVGLAAKLDAKLYAVHVLGISELAVSELAYLMTSTMTDAIVRQARAQLDAAIARHPTAHIVPVLCDGDIRRQIVHVGSEVFADLIVVGTRGRRGLARAMLGSVAEGVIRMAHCPVLVIRETP